METDRLERYRPLLPPDEWARLLEAAAHPPPPAIRINPLKADRAAAVEWAARYGWELRPVPFCEMGWQLLSAQTTPGKTLEHRLGHYYIQDAASMLPAEMFTAAGWIDNPPCILDMSASPGGKTTHLLGDVCDRGLVIANDASVARIPALRRNLQTWGAVSVAVTCFPGERFGGWFGEQFDAVLLDAPCSGEGLRTPSRPVSDAERRQLRRRQLNLLTSAFRAVKPGGEIVYATCSLHPDEDEAVLDALLRLYPRQAAIEAVEVAGDWSERAAGLAADGARVFAPAVRRAVRLWPHLCDSDGFFAARVRKLDSVPLQAAAPPRRPLSEAGWEIVNQREQRRIAEELRQAYNFDLEAALERHRLELWRNGAAVYAIPAAFLSRFAELPCVAVGLRIGEVSRVGATLAVAPAHEWVSRFWGEFTAGRLTIPEEHLEIWLAGRDLRGEWRMANGSGRSPTEPGRVILFEDSLGRFVGRGKLLRDRVRNLLPR